MGAALSVRDKPSACDQHVPDAQGRGSLEAARGSSHVSDEGVELRGEVDLFGQPWNVAWWVGHCCNDTWKADHGTLTWNQRPWTVAAAADASDSASDWDRRAQLERTQLERAQLERAQLERAQLVKQCVGRPQLVG